MIGIILAGGNGTRMYPTTLGINKHIIPIYDKPMIYYPLSILMLLKIKKIIIITTSLDQKIYKQLFINSKNLGLDIIFLIQDQPRGIAEGIYISRKYIKNKKICLILGDNIFYGSNLKNLINSQKKNINGCTIFTYNTNKPKDFAIIEYNSKNVIKSIKEKPKNSRSNKAVTGMYFFDEKVLDFFFKIKPSKRGELEITSLINQYLKIKKIRICDLGRGIVWFDAGNEDRILKCSSFIETTQNRNGYKIACIEEIALQNKWVSFKQLYHLIKEYPECSYKNYIKKLLKNK